MSVFDVSVVYKITVVVVTGTTDAQYVTIKGTKGETAELECSGNFNVEVFKFCLSCTVNT